MLKNFHDACMETPVSGFLFPFVVSFFQSTGWRIIDGVIGTSQVGFWENMIITLWFHIPMISFYGIYISLKQIQKKMGFWPYLGLIVNILWLAAFLLVYIGIL